MSERIDRLEDRVDRIEEAIIDLRVSVGSIVHEMRMLRYAIVVTAAAFLGIDMTGVL